MDKVQEIMELVEKFSLDTIACGLAKKDGAYDAQEWLGMEASVKFQEIESKLRALLERKPLTDEQMFLALHSLSNEPPKRLPNGWVEFARAIERAHGIGA